jgi:type I restriction enzyme R subunit
MHFVKDLNEEDQRAVREGLNEDSLAIYDLLIKPDLTSKEIKRIKDVASGLLKILQHELSKIQDFRAKQATRDDIKLTIRNYLWDEKTGLPNSFDPQAIEEKTEAIFEHIYVHFNQGNGESTTSRT